MEGRSNDILGVFDKANEIRGWVILPIERIIDVDNFDFVNNPEDLGTIINRIDAELNGLF